VAADGLVAAVEVEGAEQDGLIPEGEAEAGAAGGVDGSVERGAAGVRVGVRGTLTPPVSASLTAEGARPPFVDSR